MFDLFWGMTHECVSEFILTCPYYKYFEQHISIMFRLVFKSFSFVFVLQTELRLQWSGEQVKNLNE